MLRLYYMGKGSEEEKVRIPLKFLTYIICMVVLYTLFTRKTETHKVYKTTKNIEGTREWMIGFSVSQTWVQIPALTLVVELVMGQIV